LTEIREAVDRDDKVEVVARDCAESVTVTLDYADILVPFAPSPSCLHHLGRNIDADHTPDLRSEGDEQPANAAADALRIREEAAKAEAERIRVAAEALRAELLDQFNRILETRDTVRGLVVNLGDVLFDTAKYDLRPLAREKLARLAGIVLAHPGLSLEVEGHTDSVGPEELNQTLSEHRAGAVRTYLIEQGLTENQLTAKGFGESLPVADNTTAEGRQKNRRVEIIVSGEVIGTRIGR